jgi:hypothetical protein
MEIEFCGALGKSFPITLPFLFPVGYQRPDPVTAMRNIRVSVGSNFS